jgi:lysophospholipase L1-like esterase
LAVTAALALSASAVRADENDRCRAGAGNRIAEWSLPRTAESLMARQPLRIVAIGSSSTQGYGASAASFSYPAQLAHMLRARFPMSQVTVLNMGIGGEKIDQMVARFDRDVFPWDPDLVIWQTGTNDPMKNMPAAEFAALLTTGLQALKSNGIDVILMMPQYSPSFLAAKNYNQYLTAMRTIAKREDVALFDRFSMSRAWYYDRRFAATPVVSADGLHESDSGYHCVAAMLSEGIGALATRTTRTADTPMITDETERLVGRN